MPELLAHEPEGDHNPYDAVPWSRYPLEPTTDDAFTVGVRAGADLDSVIAQWRTERQHGRTELVRSNDIWTGTLGPFASDCEYRFLAPGSPHEDHKTQWFTAPFPTRWVVGYI